MSVVNLEKQFSDFEIFMKSRENSKFSSSEIFYVLNREFQANLFKIIA